MNKSDDINERKDLSRTAIDEAYKVFEFKRGQFNTAMFLI